MLVGKRKLHQRLRWLQLETGWKQTELQGSLQLQTERTLTLGGQRLLRKLQRKQKKLPERMR
jgi:hypothetical protein